MSATDCYRVKPGSKVDLGQVDTDDRRAFPVDEKEARKLLEKLNQKLEDLQELLYAERKHPVLIVLQAMDTGGKDGVIRRVFDGVNPQGVKVASFKQPTPEELGHDFLWRVHKLTPAKGEIVIFNRSHYEDVLVVRIHKLVTEAVWSKRYDHINAFERLLAEEGGAILKFFLHIDRDEQAERLQARLDEPDKRWKFNPGDLEERKLWGDYMRAYEDVFSQTSTDWAPWYIIPAKHKWYRDLVISSIVVEALRALDMHYPQPNFDPASIHIQ